MSPVAKKLIPVALVAAVLGGTAGAIITKSVHSRQDAIPAAASTTTPAAADQTAPPLTTPSPADNAAAVSSAPDTTSSATTATNTKTVYRTVTRSPRYSSRRAYYDYNSQAQKRSFWDKHRDKLTVAMGAGGGALVGGLIGGRKGAGIGLLSGGAGSALYTYKIRKHNPR